MAPRMIQATIVWCIFLVFPWSKALNRESFNTGTVQLQWLEHLWNHENMFETGVIRPYKRQVRTHNRDIFSISLACKNVVCSH